MAGNIQRGLRSLEKLLSVQEDLTGKMLTALLANGVDETPEAPLDVIPCNPEIPKRQATRIP